MHKHPLSQNFCSCLVYMQISSSRPDIWRLSKNILKGKKKVIFYSKAEMQSSVFLQAAFYQRISLTRQVIPKRDSKARKQLNIQKKRPQPGISAFQVSVSEYTICPAVYNLSCRGCIYQADCTTSLQEPTMDAADTRATFVSLG